MPGKCSKCGLEKDTFTKLCTECLVRNRLNKYRSYGRDDLVPVMAEEADSSSKDLLR